MRVKQVNIFVNLSPSEQNQINNNNKIPQTEPHHNQVLWSRSTKESNLREGLHVIQLPDN